MQHSQISDTLSLISTYKEPGPQQMLRTGFLCARERTFSFSYSFSFKEKLSMILFMLRSMWCSISHQIGIAGLDVFQDVPVFPDGENLMVLG